MYDGAAVRRYNNTNRSPHYINLIILKSLINLLGIDRTVSEKAPKNICTVKKFKGDFQNFCTMYGLNFDFHLDYCSLNKKSIFTQKNHPSNLIFLASGELFLFFHLYLHFPWLK
jgi:hypothetical protein